MNDHDADMLERSLGSFEIDPAEWYAMQELEHERRCRPQGQCDCDIGPPPTADEIRRSMRPL